MTTTYHLDIIDVLTTQINDLRNLVEEENYYLRNSNEKGQVRFDEIRKWEESIDELTELKTQVIRLRNKGTLKKAPTPFNIFKEITNG